MIRAQESEAPGRSSEGASSRTAPALRAADDFDRNVWCVLGLPIDAIDTVAAAALIEDAVRDRTRLVVATPNANWLVRALNDREARREILEADLSLADGAPVVALARLLGVPMKGRTAGSDVFETLRARSGARGRRIRVFFLGGREGSAEGAAAALAGSRGVESAGFLDPGHGDVASMSTDSVIGAINAAKADFIVVALGAAKGQTWIDRNKARLNAPVISPLGAVVDFTAGTVPRAPDWMQRGGLEWLWRIGAEPSLWRRYAADGACLAGIGAARVVPQLALGRPGAPAEPARAALVEGEGAAVINLSGQLAGDLAPVRQCFREATALGGDLVLDLSAAAALDRLFLGLVLMLEKHAARRGATIALRGASPPARKLFKANAMNYPTVAAGNGLAARGLGTSATASQARRDR